MSKALCMIGITAAGLIGMLVACCVVAGRSDEAERKYWEDYDDDRNRR